MLTALGKPHTDANIQALVMWSIAEGGHYKNAAQYNPLNTKRDEPGSWWMAGRGARAYPDYPTGIKATVDTLNNGLYSRILSALDSGNDPMAVIHGAVNSKWAESRYTGDQWSDFARQAKEQIASASCAAA